MALARAGFTVAGVDELLFLLAMLAAGGGALLIELGRDRPLAAARSAAEGERRRVSIAPPAERHGLTEDGVRPGRRCARPRAERRRAGHVRRDVVRALRLQALAAAARPACPATGRRVLVGPGENAGALDIGDGLAVVFKVESHNHPSAVEPYQGAATGVGGIIRDIFTMGARPIALLNSLRFGPLEPAEDPTAGPMRPPPPATATCSAAWWPASRATATASASPTSAARSPSTPATPATRWSTPCASAIARHDEITLARAAGAGNALLLVGAATGRDGIQGATFASARLDDDREERRPAVQVGNPFLEKLLMEACLELSGSEAVVAMQDLGAAGLTCALAELSARGGCGAEVDSRPGAASRAGHDALRGAAQRVAGADAAGGPAGHEAEVREAFARYELHAVAIGRVIDEPVIRAALPRRARCARSRAGRWPTTRRATSLPAAPPADLEARRAERLDDLAAEPADARHAARPAGQPERPQPQAGLAPLRPHERHEHPGRPGRAATRRVLRVKGTRRALALSIDGPGRRAARSTRAWPASRPCSRARSTWPARARTPIGITDCLNFGSPETPAGYWQLARGGGRDGRRVPCARRARSSRATSASTTRRRTGPILPTPVVGTVGLLEDRSRRCRCAGARATRSGCSASRGWTRARSPPRSSPGGSGRRGGTPLAGDLTRPLRLVSAAGRAGRDGIVAGAHDLSVGGLGVALARMDRLRPGAETDEAQKMVMDAGDLDDPALERWIELPEPGMKGTRRTSWPSGDHLDLARPAPTDPGRGRVLCWWQCCCRVVPSASLPWWPRVPIYRMKMLAKCL